MNTAKTTCPEHRRVGYAYSWHNGASTLTCRGCGLPDTAHETMMETVRRLADEMGA